jgi:hypothetical protein
MSIAGSAFTAGYTGSVAVANTTAKTGRFRGFFVNSNAVVSACLDKDGNSLMTIMGLTGTTLLPGPFHCVADGNYISSITLTSGSIVLYNE